MHNNNKRIGSMLDFIATILLVAVLASVVPAAADNSGTDCNDNGSLGNFDPRKDLFLAHFDVKTDVDDLHSAAAVRTLLAAPEFRCVRYLVVAGTYGTQEGDYVPAPALFARAFGNSWRDAHNDDATAVADVAAAVRRTIEAGGDVWIMEAGQSDFSARVLQRVVRGVSANNVRDNVHIVQHSDWNESVTSPEALVFVKANADYRKIPDGNALDNGSPGYRTEDGRWWTELESDADVGDVWREARQVADTYNGVGYLNEAVAAGGFDFSDTVEAMYIFGLDRLDDTDAFFEALLQADSLSETPQ